MGEREEGHKKEGRRGRKIKKKRKRERRRERDLFYLILMNVCVRM